MPINMRPALYVAVILFAYQALYLSGFGETANIGEIGRAAQTVKLRYDDKNPRFLLDLNEENPGYPYLWFPPLSYTKRKWGDLNSWGKRNQWTRLNSWGKKKRKRDLSGDLLIGPPPQSKATTYSKSKLKTISSWGKRDNRVKRFARMFGNEDSSSDGMNEDGGGYLVLLNVPDESIMIGDKVTTPKRGWSSLHSWGKKRYPSPNTEFLNPGNTIWGKRPDDWREFHSWGKRAE